MVFRGSLMARGTWYTVFITSSNCNIAQHLLVLGNPHVMIYLLESHVARHQPYANLNVLGGKGNHLLYSECHFWSTSIYNMYVVLWKYGLICNFIERHTTYKMM